MGRIRPRDAVTGMGLFRRLRPPIAMFTPAIGWVTLTETRRTLVANHTTVANQVGSMHLGEKQGSRVTRMGGGWGRTQKI